MEFALLGDLLKCWNRKGKSMPIAGVRNSLFDSPITSANRSAAST